MRRAVACILAIALMAAVFAVGAAPAYAGTISIAGATLSWDDAAILQPQGCAKYPLTYANQSGIALLSVEYTLTASSGAVVDSSAAVGVPNGATGVLELRPCDFLLANQPGPYTMTFAIEGYDRQSREATAAFAFTPRPVPPAPVCAPTLAEATAAAGAWSLPYLGWRSTNFYLPELQWQEQTVSTSACTPPMPVRINRVVAKGAGKGQIVLRFAPGDVCNTIAPGSTSCVLLFDGRRYNLKDKAVRDRLYCTRVAYAPDETLPLFITSAKQPPDARPDAERGMTDTSHGRWAYASNFRSDLCLPTPRAPGRFPLVYSVVDRQEKLQGQGWIFRCTSTGSTTTCRWLFDGDVTLGDTCVETYLVTVRTDAVTMTKSANRRDCWRA